MEQPWPWRLGTALREAWGMGWVLLVACLPGLGMPWLLSRILGQPLGQPLEVPWLRLQLEPP